MEEEGERGHHGGSSGPPGWVHFRVELSQDLDGTASVGIPLPHCHCFTSKAVWKNLRAQHQGEEGGGRGGANGEVDMSDDGSLLFVKVGGLEHLDAPHPTDLLLRVTFVEEKSQEEGAGVGIKQQRKQEFRLHFSSGAAESMGLMEGEIVAARLVDARSVHLEQVVLQAVHPDGFRTEHQVDEAFKKSIREEVMVLCKGQAITVTRKAHSFKYKVVETQPLNQGVATVNTTVILLAHSQELQQRKYSKKTLTENSSACTEDLTEALIMCDSILPQLHFGEDSESSSDSIQTEPLQFPVGILPCPSFFYDEAVELGVTLEALRKMHLFSGSWVVVTSYPKKKSHLGCIYAVEDTTQRPFRTGNPRVNLSRKKAAEKFDFQDDIVYLSPPLLHSLGVEPDLSRFSVNIQPYFPKKHQEQPNPNEEFTGLLPPVPIATKAVISRVKSFASSGTKAYSKQIAAYFKQTKVVQRDDIIAIPVPNASIFEASEEDEEEEYQQCTFDAYNNPNLELVYFKIILLEPQDQQFLCVNKNLTTLFQEGALNSRIPLVPRSIPPAGLEKEYGKLHSILSPYLHPLSSSLGLQCSILIRGQRGCGKRSIVEAAASQLGVHLMEVNCYELLGQIEAHTESSLRDTFKMAEECVPCVLLLSNLEAIEKSVQPHQLAEPRSIMPNVVRDCLVSSVGREGHPLLVIATANSIDSVSGHLRGLFRHEIAIQAPNEIQRREFIEELLHGVECSSTVSFSKLAKLTASFTRSDLVELVTRASSNAVCRIENTSSKRAVEAGIGTSITYTDFENAIEALKSGQSSSIGAPKIPKVSWQDVGGLAVAKQEILDTIQLPLERPELFSKGIKSRSGVLLYGPPGTGKTLMAKAVATECSLNFLSVKGPELINMYVGESEKNVRDLFEKARAARPCVIFFDELDSLAPNRGHGADSGGVMDRIVSQLLAELHGLQKSADLFVIGATNRPDLIDPALLRPGRFDRMVYLGISEDHASQLKILQALSRKFTLAPETSLERIIEKCPLNLTGADFYALCSDALLTSINDTIVELEEEATKSGSKIKTEGVVVQVHEKHFERALSRLTPSVSEKELQYYKSVQGSFNPK